MGLNKGQRVFWVQGGKYGQATGNEIKLGSYELVEVKFDDGSKRGVLPSQLQPVGDSMDFSSLFHQRNFSDFNHFRQYFTHKRIEGHLTNVVYSMKYGNVEFLPYQFKPVFKFIEANEQRLLIADEVGLGKTIESLYIWKELQAREDALRLLVVCPAMLRGKWQKDMEQRFGIEAQIVDASRLLDICREVRKNNHKPFALVTSLEGIRQKETDEENLTNGAKTRKSVELNQLFDEISDDPSFNQLFDLAIFDEAAKLTNPGTANFTTAKRINRISKNLLLLSATPVSNSQSDLYSLLRLLSPSEYKNEYVFNELYEQNTYVVKLAHCFYNPAHNLSETMDEANTLLKKIKGTPSFGQDPFFEKVRIELKERLLSDELRIKTYDQISDRFFYSNVFSRSRKRDVLDNVALRRADTAGFTLSEFELKIYNSCTKDLVDMCRLEHDRIFTFGIMARQRELASSIPAAIRRWKEVAVSREMANEEDEFEDDSESERRAPSIPETALNLSAEDLDRLEREDRKYAKFLEAIRSEIKRGREEGKNEKIIVFSFFRQTLRYLSSRLLRDGVSSLVIMGGMSQEEKDRNLAKFRDDASINVLLSSEVGAEGLDMQFSSLEFNYDLPWNPMRLEQRIGRIDRIGQKADKIRIVNMFCSNTIEDEVLQKLYKKIRIFEESIGELDEILGQQTREIEMELLSPNLLIEDKRERAEAAIGKFYTELLRIKKLEESAGLSKAFSDSIINYVNTAQQNSRYIRKEDIINYMYDFFTQDGHGTDFSPSKKYPDCWTLKWSDKDRASLNAFMQSTGKYFAGANVPELTCTFPQGKKVVNPVFANIDVTHPIIKWIGECITKRSNTNQPRCFTLNVPRRKINGSVFDKSAYVFYVCYFECKGLKRKKEIMYYVVSPEEMSVKTSLESESFVSQSLFNGYRVSNLNARMNMHEGCDFDAALDLCKKSFSDSMESLTRELEDGNSAIYHRMLAKTRSYYEDKLEGIRDSIARLEMSVESSLNDLVAILRKETGLRFTTTELEEKASDIRRYLGLKKSIERETFESLSGNQKEMLNKAPTVVLEKFNRLQQYTASLKGQKTKLENTAMQYNDAVSNVESQKKLDISFEELGGGIVFVED